MDLLRGKTVLAAVILVTSLPRTEVVLLSVQIYTPCDIEMHTSHINRRSAKICGISEGVQVRWYLPFRSQIDPTVLQGRESLGN